MASVSGSTVLPERPFVNRKARRRCGWEQRERRGPSRRSARVSPTGFADLWHMVLPSALDAPYSPWPGRHGRASQPVDATPDLGEQRPRHRHLGQLKGHVTAVAHEPLCGCSAAAVGS
jgi:hypothetical protein